MAGHLVHAVRDINGTERVLYIVKTGALMAECMPNEWLATRNGSVVDGRLIEWDSAFEKGSALPSNVRPGVHLTVPTPLCETKSWLQQEWTAKCSWVDCEVGRMAAVAKACGMSFRYMHIVSDNIVTFQPQKLTNGRADQVQRLRTRRFSEIKGILEGLFASEEQIDL